MPASTSPARRSRSAAGRATWFKISSFLGGGDMKTIPSVAALLLAAAVSSAHAQKGIRVCRVGGRQYGLVHAAGTSLLIYRKDLAQQLGLKPPRTWADLVANAKAFTTGGMYGITIPGDNLFINILLGELLKANGGIFFDKQNRPQLSSKPMLETLEFIRDLTRYAPPGWEGHGYLETFTNLYG